MMAWRVGDLVPLAPSGPIVDERWPVTDHQGVRSPCWHALMVLPQREAAARDWLARRGVEAFFPVQERTATIRGRQVVSTKRFLPGMIFAEFRFAPIWHRIIGSPFIHNAIRLRSGAPGRIHPKSLEALRAMRSTAEALAEAKRAAAEIRPGAKARIRRGLLEGQEIEVHRVTVNGRAVFTLEMFGGKVEAEAPVSDMERIASG